MYNRIVRDDRFMANFSAHIQAHWPIQIQSMAVGDRGFYGETWVVAAKDGNKYFAKLDSSWHKEVFRRNLPILKGLMDQHIEGVAPLIVMADGGLYTEYAGGVLAIFAFIEGEHREDYPPRRLFEALTKVYRAAPPEGIERETFSASVIDRIDAHLAKLGHDGADARLRALIAAKATMLSRFGDRLRALSKACESDTSGFFVTHGDAGGNVILTDTRFTLIDWDHPMYAPPERDAWFFVSDASFPQFDESLRAAGIDHRIRPERVAYYGYYTYHYYLLEYLNGYMMAETEAQRDEFTEGIEGFFGCWINTQLAFIDANL